jgi:uncharacterized protein
MMSPCNKICVIDAITKTCDGCGRTLQEITNWTRYTEEQRRVIMERLKEKP